MPVPLTRWEIGREFGKSADLGRTAAEFARHSRAPATESAYASDWADFSSWCNSADRLALPAEPVTIGAYLSDRSGILKVSSDCERDCRDAPHEYHRAQFVERSSFPKPFLNWKRAVTIACGLGRRETLRSKAAV